MNPLGWTFMIVSVGGVWSLAIYCYYRVLTSPTPPPDELREFRSA